MRFSSREKRAQRQQWSPRRQRSWKRRLHVETLERRELLAADVLYVGDGGTDAVQTFDANTGAYLGSFAEPGFAGLHGPRGMILNGGHLLLVNQNVNTAFNGEVLRWNTSDDSQSPLVDADNPRAPFAPRGIVLRDNVLYVADFEGSAYPSIVKFNATTGEFLGELVAPNSFVGEFRPRGLVFGPDGGLFVSTFSETLFDSADPAGYIWRFDTTTGSSRIVAWNDGDGTQDVGEVRNLHNPEGLAFSPDGKLYVTSNRGNEHTHILVIDPASGNQLDNIELNPHTRPDNPTQVSAQAILFGPSDKLFIPITTTSLNDGLAAGGIWTYDPATKQIASFVTPSLYDPVLQLPWYLTFRQTNPATLAYQPWHNFENPLDVDHSGSVVFTDVLLLIAEINHRTVTSQTGRLPSTRGTSDYYYDVNGDGFVAPIDALRVINYLNRRARTRSSPTQAVAASPAVAAASDLLAGSAEDPAATVVPLATQFLDSSRSRFAATVDAYFSSTGDEAAQRRKRVISETCPNQDPPTDSAEEAKAVS